MMRISNKANTYLLPLYCHDGKKGNKYV